MIPFSCPWSEEQIYVCMLDCFSFVVLAITFAGTLFISFTILPPMQPSDSSLDRSLDTLSCTATFCSTRTQGA